MKYYFLTLFPEIISVYFHESMMGRAVENKCIEVQVIDIRDFSGNKHHRVDDYPYGGGAGMVIAAPPVIRAIQSIPNYQEYPVIFLSPGGKTFSSDDSKKLSLEKGLVFLCGHYEGIDQRAIDRFVTAEYSLGDFVLTGGELPALAMADAIARQVPGVLGNAGSLEEESFENDLLEYPQYTRPEVVDDIKVPEVLLSGHHANIKKWRHQQAEKKTAEKRPDLYEKYLEKKQ